MIRERIGEEIRERTKRKRRTRVTIIRGVRKFCKMIFLVNLSLNRLKTIRRIRT